MEFSAIDDKIKYLMHRNKLKTLIVRDVMLSQNIHMLILSQTKTNITFFSFFDVTHDNTAFQGDNFTFKRIIIYFTRTQILFLLMHRYYISLGVLFNNLPTFVLQDIKTR